MSEALASERQHWYAKDGTPAYEVPCTSKEGNRPTNITDARKLNLVPSVTLILNQIAKPGLEAWKLKQMLEAALTLPRLKGESVDQFAARVIEDSKAQTEKAKQRGTDLHAAIEDYIRGQTSFLYGRHCEKIDLALEQLGIPLRDGNPERSFSSDLGYGGKIDYSIGDAIPELRDTYTGTVVDFKTKARLDAKTKPYDENVMQLAAYGFGVFSEKAKPFRALNVFVGIDDCEVKVFEHKWGDINEAFSQFRCLLSYWKRKNKFGPYKNEK